LDPSTIDELEVDQFGKNKLTARHLCFTNKVRIEINDKVMRRMLKQKRYAKPLVLPALPYDASSQEMHLIAGTPLIAKTNQLNMDIANNENFVVKEVRHKQGYILIAPEDQQDNDQYNIKVQTEDVQRLFNMAFAVTIHKSQGMTIDQPYTIHEWDKISAMQDQDLSNRLKYVALSRATRKENINVV